MQNDKSIVGKSLQREGENMNAHESKFMENDSRSLMGKVYTDSEYKSTIDSSHSWKMTTGLLWEKVYTESEYKSTYDSSH